DDYSASTYQHNQGLACLTCHKAPANGADGEDFLSGGTVYTELSGNSSDKYAGGYKIRVLLDTELAIDYEYDSEGGTANSYSENSALSSSYDFTAQVIDSDGEVVNYSATNSHATQTHLNCNSCHSVSGENGAQGRVVNFK
ncbi:MAG: hypothetical protein U9P38_05465, partial [Campylobacterota bacterium]|nr:hypothetical protein [Campylobacterota bacterium]